MEKTFSKIEINTIKSIAKNVAPYVAKKEKIDAQIQEVEEKVAEAIRKRAAEKIEKLNAEKQTYQDIIDSMNATVKRITDGYTTEDLVETKKEATGQMDPKTGKEIFKTVYTLKYPETVVPPTTEEAESECPSHEEAPEEMPEELQQQEAEVAGEASTDPFAGADEWS